MSITDLITMNRIKFKWDNGEECTWDTIKRSEFTQSWWLTGRDMCPPDAEPELQHYIPADDRWYTQAEIYELMQAEKAIHCKNKPSL